MPELSSPEIIDKKPCMGEQLFNEVKNSFGKDTERARNCVRVLKNIPENLVELSYAHLQSEFIRDSKYNHNHPENTPDSFNDAQYIEGFVNEVLANIQIRQTRPELRGNNNPEIRKELDNYEEKILAVANNPERFNLDWHVGRNPDVAWLDLDDQGRVIINGIGEITTSRQLNKRKYLQLQESGFASNLRNIARRLNGLTDGVSRGLNEFGVGKKQLEVSSQLKRFLVVHHDLDTTPEGLANSIGKSVSNEEFSHLDYEEKRKVFSETEKQSFVDLLKSPSTVIIKSVFNNNEIKLITEYILKKIKTNYPGYQPKSF